MFEFKFAAEAGHDGRDVKHFADKQDKMARCVVARVNL